MPSPLAHTLMAVTYFQVTAPPEQRKPRLGTVAAMIAASNLPDFHYLPALLLGMPHRFHFNFLHAPMLAVTAGLISYAVLKFVGAARAGFWAASLLALYLSHIALDFLCRYRMDDSGSLPGVPLLWPLMERNFTSPAHIFFQLQKDGLDRIVSWNNLLILLEELVIFGLAIALLALWRRRAVPPENVMMN